MCSYTIGFDDLTLGLQLSASVAKVTALAPLPLLERLSDLLRWRHMHPDFQLPWDETGLPLLAPESPTFHVRTPPRALDAEEEKHVSAAHERLWKLVEACQQRGLPILFDAEYSDVQPAIDYLALNAALRFNRPGSPQVYATFQAYLKDALPRLSLAAEAFSNRGVPLGVKLVRGAYLSRENALAAARSAESPVHSSIQDTHRCYDQCVAYVLERATSGEAYIVVATHNVESGEFTTIINWNSMFQVPASSLSAHGIVDESLDQCAPSQQPTDTARMRLSVNKQERLLPVRLKNLE